MKKPSLLFATAGMAMLTACAPLKVDQLPSRTPTDFLLDIKAVADANDFTNIDAVGKRLRIELVADPEEPVYASDEKTLLGYAVTVKNKRMTQEYLPENFRFRNFQPVDRSFDRALVSMMVNPRVICVTPADLVEVFGEVARSINAHTSSIGYSYENLRIKDFRAYFNFEQYGCLYKFGFFKNRNKE
jgi:hypothetical protein